MRKKRDNKMKGKGKTRFFEGGVISSKGGKVALKRGGQWKRYAGTFYRVSTSERKNLRAGLF